MVENTHNKKIIGRLEYISFPDFGIENIEAKIDTGAYNGSIHVSSVEEVEKDGVRVLKFRLIDKDHPQYQDKDFFASEFSQKKIISSNGKSQIRYLISVRFFLGEQEFISFFSLSNRKALRRPVLLGRRNIKKHFLINAARKFVLGAN
jgi:hypothetical protein